ncbi:glycoside hydrolase family 3 protein [Butyrivibrio sp. VCD2006]|uniref:glycoside hydrolase family 3 protein n=1 Tax=Butyrivibrio sp. VCD2006 TaxID=1280664 RepID=UPI0003F4E9B7|nr:glycoside hydrolase family 3 protein [Butyrivibrio sp. VCD2006]
MKGFCKRIISTGVVAILAAGTFLMPAYAGGYIPEVQVDETIENMTLDEKISQMIIPAIRTWNEENVTDLEAFPVLKEVLKKHQYGGIILFGSNITGNDQITQLINDLQKNNSENSEVSTNIPYLLPVDEEGGIVIRLTAGTRMTGNMAIGATPDAENNAKKTGEILGEELAAVGFNANYAPDVDVNNNPSNPVIGTRSFSDDPAKVGKLGIAYARGLEKNNIIATFKHFPGHGDTSVDSHIGTPSVEKTYDEIKKTELVPFKEAIGHGADMIMTAHITFPLIDEEVTYGDGVTKGFYPATMSKKIITDILRGDLGFNGVVVTDALEMDAIRTAGLVPGKEDSSEYHVNIATEVINAGADILLLPKDLNNSEVATFYDEYIEGLSNKVESGEISEERINESVKRILMLKAKYGIFDPENKAPEEEDIETRIENSKEIVGSKAHHDEEMNMAKEAITLLKNDDNLLPLSKEMKSIVFFGRQPADLTNIGYAIDNMKKQGYISEDAVSRVYYYYDSSADEKLNYTDEMKSDIEKADAVIAFSYAGGNGALDKESEQFIALHNALDDVHKGGGKFVLLSENLPYDAAIYDDADAIVLAYMGSGLGVDPTDKSDNGGMQAINANIIAAIETICGANSPKGKLPVNVPVVEEQQDGTLSYGTEYLYKRGAGLTY